MNRQFYIGAAIALGCLAAGASSAEAADHRPLIGVSCSNTGVASATNHNYTESVIAAGGVPVMIPVTADSLVLRDIVARIDGLVLVGGGDVHPAYYGEEMLPECETPDSLRDVSDIMLLRLARDMGKPILGVCRGHQLMNVVFGGSLYQDIPSQTADTTVMHRQKEDMGVATQTIRLNPDSRLARMTGTTEMPVNSAHHQGVKEMAPGFHAVAWTTDGIVEAMEPDCNLPMLGVQFHPEALYWRGNDTIALSIFSNLVDQAAIYRHAMDILSEAIALDTHADTPLRFARGAQLGNRDPRLQVNIPRMIEGGMSAQYLACWVEQGALDPEGRAKAKARVDELIDSCYSQISRNADRCALAVTPDDVKRIKDSGRLAMLLGVENGYGLGTDLSVLDGYADRGVGYLTLCHSRNNDICDSSTDPDGPLWGGLSPFGRKVVKRMNETGMVIDLSHASDDTFADVLRITKTPVVCSHSSSRALHPHARNLTDDQLRALARNGGVAQACAVSYFLSSDPEVTIDHFMAHLLHMIEVAGVDHVGIGSDFDGGAGIDGFSGSNCMVNVAMRLIEAGFSDSDIAKIMGGNYLRVLGQVQNEARRPRTAVSVVEKTTGK